MKNLGGVHLDKEVYNLVNIGPDAIIVHWELEEPGEVFVQQDESGITHITIRDTS